MDEKKVKLWKKVLEDSKTKTVFLAGGVFGEVRGCDGYVEEIMKENGTQLKIYGCSYLSKGFQDEKKVQGLEFVKSLIFLFPQLVLAQSWIYLIAVGVRFLFTKKKLINDIDWLLEEVRYKVVRHYDIPDEEYSEFGRELKRVSRKVLADQFNITFERSFYQPGTSKFKEEPSRQGELLVKKYFPDPVDVKGQDIQFGWLLARLCKFIIFFLEGDTAYIYRFKDAFGSDKKDVFQLLDHLISRETEKGIGWKWVFIKRALKLAYILEPRLKRFLNALLNELDYDKMKMDEADRYFSLVYLSYDFGGINFKERLAERKRIDIEKGHIFLIGVPPWEDEKYADL